VHATVLPAIEQLLARVGSTADIKRVIVAGGGAPVFEQVLREREPALNSVIVVEPEPYLANVKGFYLAGLAVAESAARAMNA